VSLHPLWEEVLEVRGGATAPRAPLHAAALSPNDASSSAGECLYIKRSCGVVLIENRKQENGPGPGRREGSRVPREPAMPRNVKIPSFYSVFQFGKHPTPVIARVFLIFQTGQPERIQTVRREYLSDPGVQSADTPTNETRYS
jgi:hypothetical protein